MLNHRIRIFSSLLLAFIVVNVYANFSGIKDALANFKFPTIKNFNFLSNQVTKPQNNQHDASVDFYQTSPAPFDSPTLAQGKPTVIPTGSGNPTPTLPAVVLTEAGPTNIPAPTNTPKPTKPPKPTATPKPPAINSELRPGSTMQEIFIEVQKRFCVPAALIHAFQTQESGPYFNYNSPSSTIKIYNTYGWWKTGTGNPCFGLGYSTQSGLVPSDSVMAGEICRNAVQPDAYDQKIMGILQISQFEQDAVKKYLTGIINGSYDRRVLFDNAAIFAIITKNRIGSPPKDCNNWSDDAIKTAAEKHYGSCGDNYCTNILKYYKQYR